MWRGCGKEAEGSKGIHSVTALVALCPALRVELEADGGMDGGHTEGKRGNSQATVEQHRTC